MVDITKKKMTHLQLPRWASKLYGLLAIVLVPWILELAHSLPSRHLERHWDTVWVGFDILMLLLIALTVWAIIKRTIWFVVSASALGALFIVDVWFDVLTSQPGRQRHEALLFGVIEVSLAILTYWLVYRVIRYALHHQN